MALQLSNSSGGGDGVGRNSGELSEITKSFMRSVLKDSWCILGGSRYESQDVHLQMYECSWANSKPASLYRERRITEATPRLQNFKHTPADPISLCGHFTYSALRRYERLPGVFICFPKQLYVFTKETLFWTGVVDCEHDLIQPGVSQSA